MDKLIPTEMAEILKSHAAIVQKLLVNLNGFAIGRYRPEEARHRFDDFPELVIAFPKGLLRPLALGQVEHESHALVAALVEARHAQQHGHAAAVLAEIL